MKTQNQVKKQTNLQQQETRQNKTNFQTNQCNSDNQSQAESIKSDQSNENQQDQNHLRKQIYQQNDKNDKKEIQTISHLKDNPQIRTNQIKTSYQKQLKFIKQQPIKDLLQKLKISEKNNQIDQNEEWIQNQSQLDQKQEQKNIYLQNNQEQQDQQNNQEQQEQNNFNKCQITAIYDDDDIRYLMLNKQQSNQILDKAFIDQFKQQDTLLSVHHHNIQNKILLILYLLYRKQIYQIVPKQRRNCIDLHPANRNKIKIFTSDKQELKNISMKISQIIRKISVIKLQIKPDQAKKMKNSKILSLQLLKKKKIIFSYRNYTERSYYFGGQSTQSQLNVEFKQIRNYKYKYFRIFDYPNTRSYKIILSRIITNKQFLKSLNNFRTMYLQLIQYIPNPYSKQNKQRQKCLCFLMTVNGYLDNVSPKQLQNHITSYINNNFICLTFIIKRIKSLRFPKLKVQGVDFIYLKQKRFNKSYIYIISHKDIYLNKKQEIIIQLQKLNNNNLIYGIRFFKNIPPEIKRFDKQSNYKLFLFPENRPYSYVLTPKLITKNQNIMQKQIKMEEKQQKNFINLLLQQEQKNQQQKILKKYYQFDWKKYLN